MTAHLARIHRFLDGLARRDRGLRALRAVAGAVAASGLGASVLAMLVSAGYATPRAGWVWVSLPVVGALVALLVPLRGWGAAADRRLQAGRVEAVEPAFRGELLTVLDRSERPLGSAALVERIAARAADRIEAVPATAVLPGRAVRPSLVAAVVGVFVVALAAGLLPVGPVLAVQLLLTPSPSAVPSAPVVSDGPKAVLGDITLRYLYPTYTRLEPLDVPNSSGEVRAPPGTRVEVRARSAVAYDAAMLEVYDAEPTPVDIVGGRDLSAAFVVAGPGAWRFRFGALPTADYPIVPDPDLPPDVSVDLPRRQLTLAADLRLPFRWAAKDDYGIERVVVEVKKGNATHEVELRKPLDGPRQLGEPASVTSADLGLVPGDRATLRIGAWDNDAVSGSKAGWSAPIDLEVIGQNGTGARAMEVRRQLRDALVAVLADFLVEPSPPYRAGSEGPGWATAANERYAAFDALVRAAWGGVDGTGIDARTVAEVNARRRDLVGFARIGTGGELVARDAETLRALQAAHIAAVEDAALLFDQIIRQAAAVELARLAREIASEAESLEASFSSFSREQALAGLDKIERQLARLMREAATLGDSTLEEFVNQRTTSIDALIDEVRRAIAEGRMDDARALMERLSKQLRELAEGLQESQRQQGEADDRLQKAMDKLDADLEALQRDQEALQAETAAAREKHGGDLDDALAAWEEAERKTAAVADALSRLGPSFASPGLPPSLSGGLGDARAETGGLLDSIQARNLEVAQERVIRALSELAMLRGGVEAAARRVPSAADTLANGRRVVAAQAEALDQVRRILDQLARSRASASPQLQRDLEELAARQDEISERAEQASEDAGKISKSLPMKAPGLERGAQQGAEEADRAGEGLRDGDPMTAEGGQQAAADGFRQARDALESAKRDLQQMQQASQGGGSEDRGEQEGASSGGADPRPDRGEIRLPAPEEFQTPEAYRNALLEGMSGEVPEEYRSLNRRYYEELVRQ